MTKSKLRHDIRNLIFRHNVTNGKDEEIDQGIVELIEFCIIEVLKCDEPTITNLSAQAHANSVKHGFWPKGGRNAGEAIALIHEECSEWLSGIRKPGPAEHIGDTPEEFTQEEEEAADVVIRTMDLSYGRGLRLLPAILRKMAFNEGRPHKHGKSF